MPKQKFSQYLKVRDGEVGETCGLITFLAKYSNSNVSCLNHIYIVCSVTDCESDLIFEILSHNQGNSTFISW